MVSRDSQNYKILTPSNVLALSFCHCHPFLRVGGWSLYAVCTIILSLLLNNIDFSDNSSVYVDVSTVAKAHIIILDW